MPGPASVSSDNVGAVANGAALLAVMWFEFLQMLAADGGGGDFVKGTLSGGGC